MKDLKGREINFADEEIFPMEYMLPIKNRVEKEEIHTEYEKRSENEEAEEMASFTRYLHDKILD